MLKILMIGDTYGEPGRKAIEKFVPAMKRSGEVDFVVCNAENSADGAGITERIALGSELAGTAYNTQFSAILS